MRRSRRSSTRILCACPPASPLGGRLRCWRIAVRHPKMTNWCFFFEVFFWEQRTRVTWCVQRKFLTDVASAKDEDSNNIKIWPDRRKFGSPTAPSPANIFGSFSRVFLISFFMHVFRRLRGENSRFFSLFGTVSSKRLFQEELSFWISSFLLFTHLRSGGALSMGTKLFLSVEQ